MAAGGRRKRAGGRGYSPDLSVLASIAGRLMFSPAISAAAARILRLRESDAKIVNLTGYSNTDLKMAYGAANLSVLTEYDANYTTLVTALQECGKALYEAGRFEEAARILEFSAMTGTDISACYRLLTDLYKTKLSYDQEKAADKIAALLPIAESLRSLSRDGIVKIVSEAL